MCDQLRAFEVGCYGSQVVRTPAIDALAHAGVRFDLAVSNNPLCSPARACLLSGQYSRTCLGKLGNESEEFPARHRDRFPQTTMPEAFRQENYRTALIGKWHVAGHPALLGFDECVYPKVHHLNTNQLYTDQSGRVDIVTGLAEDHNLSRLDAFLAAQSGHEAPFFVFYNIATPHMPYFDVPAEFTRMYSRRDVQLRDNVFVNGVMAHDEHWFRIYLWDYLYSEKFFANEQFTSPYQLPDGFDLRDLTALYCGMVSYTDKYVGALCDLLRQYGAEDDTIVVFTSDHGDNLGSHHRFNKQLLLEESIRIPLIIRDPRGPAQIENTAQVASLIDVMPTLLSLCDIDIPDHVQGQDLTPLVTGSRSELAVNRAYIETLPWEIGVRTPSHLYGMHLDSSTRLVCDDRKHFYDLTRDPYQLRNVAKETRGAPAEGEQLRRELLAWNEHTPWDSLGSPVQ